MFLLTFCSWRAVHRSQQLFTSDKGEKETFCLCCHVKSVSEKEIVHDRGASNINFGIFAWL